MSNNCNKKYIIQTNILVGEQGEQGPPGPPGPGSEIELPLSSDDVVYPVTDQTLTEIIDQLLYTALIINSFSASQTVYEKGQTLTSITFSWAFNKSVQMQTITGINVVTPTLNVSDRVKVVALNNVSTNTVVTLTADDVVGDGNVAKSRTLTLQFLNRIHWGVATIPGTINSAFILGLSSSELKANGLKTFTISSGLNQYIWYAIPSTYVPISFKTNGFNGGFQFVETISHTNASGHTENYNVYRSNNHNLGLTAVEAF